MKYTYKTKNTCARQITFDLDADVVRNISFSGGCDGNLKTIQRLLEGSTVSQIDEKCRGIHCGYRDTSCADQLATAVREAYGKSRS